MAFHNFRQNNTGGSFDFDSKRGISVNVIIEGDNIDDINAKAERIGLYWDAVESGGEWPCCGDRWSQGYEWDNKHLSAFPQVYDINIEENLNSPPDEDNYVHMTLWIDGPNGFIHYADGRVVPFWDATKM